MIIMTICSSTKALSIDPVFVAFDAVALDIEGEDIDGEAMVGGC